MESDRACFCKGNLQCIDEQMNTVCIATYNGEKYIVAQLKSILEQLQPKDEIVVSDDGSTDNTIAKIESVGDKRVRVIHSGYHMVKKNFENALRAARGDIIFLSDQDDVWLPGKYARCVKELERVDLVCTNSIMTDEDLQVVNEDFFSLYHSGPGILKNAFNNTYYGSCMAFRRKLLDKALPFPKTREIGHDIWLGLVAEMTGTVAFLNTPYLLYRRHSGTSTQTDALWTRSKRPLWRKVWSRVVVLYNIGKFRIQHRHAR